MRLIDADELMERLRERFYMHNLKSDFDRCARSVILSCMEAVQRSTTIYEQPNAPLTLDELREMDGEPVWIAPATDGGKIPERWMLVSDYLPENRIFLFMPPGGMTQGYKAVTYGKTWLAYRRRPEEVDQ